MIHFQTSSGRRSNEDTFDRIIVAQAKTEDLCIISHDDIIRKYPVAVEW